MRRVNDSGEKLWRWIDKIDDKSGKTLMWDKTA